MNIRSSSILLGPFTSSAVGTRQSVDLSPLTFGTATVFPGRRVLTSVLDSNTFKTAIIVLSAAIGLFLLALLIWSIVTKCGRRKSAPVAPGGDAAAAKGGGGAGGVDLEKGPLAAKTQPAVTPPPSQQQAAVGTVPTPPAPQPAAGPGLAPRPGPVPPWQSDPQRLPPGIMLTPLTPPLYTPLVSNPRLATEPPYERLVLLSSRVYNPEMVVRAVLPNVAYVVYDWKNFTLQELLRYVKKVLGSQKVMSIAIVAPGSKPGTVGLLEGAGTSPDKLASKTELSQFWRVLAGCVALSGAADGRRIDLLGCRVVEAPREGALLLKELWNLTTVPFAAADDALGGYMLCTFMEEPTTKQLSLISSTIPAIDLYFDRSMLLGIPPPGTGGAAAGGRGEIPVAASAPLPPGPPPPEAIARVGSAPSAPTSASPPAQAPPPATVPVSAPPPAMVPVSAPPPPPPTQSTPPLQSTPPATSPLGPVPGPALASTPGSAPSAADSPTGGNDVFTRLSRALAERGKTPDAAFSEYDRDGNGQLTTGELTALMRGYLPDASAIDIKHFQAMLDTDAVEAEQERLLSRREFVDGLPQNVRIQEQVREGRDDYDVVPRLQDYLTENEQILRDVFEQYDESGDGCLDHIELQNLVDSIPGLEPHEKKFILALFYAHDSNRDLRISLEEMQDALHQFRMRSKISIARAVVPPPGTASSAAATASPPVQEAPPPPPPAQAAPPPPPPADQVPVPGRSADAGTTHPQQELREEAAAPQPPPPLPPPRAILTPLGPPSSKLAPLAPLGPGGALPRPGALAPLAPLPGQ